MAITRDAHVSTAYGTFAATPLTLGASANRLLVFVRDDAGALTGITYGGVAMTSVGTLNNPGGGTYYAYSLLNPPTGTNNIVIGGSASGALAAVAYTGVTAIDASGSGAGTNGPTLTGTLTAVHDNDWGVFFAFDRTGASPTANLHCTAVETPGGGASMTLFDTNSPITPPGAFSMAANTGSGDGYIMVLLQPLGSNVTGQMFAVF